MELKIAEEEMETQVRTNGDGASPRTNLGALLSGVTVSAATPPEGGGEQVVAGNGNGIAVPPDGGAGGNDETSKVVESVAATVAPDTKLKFQAWLMVGIFVILKNFLRHVKPETLFSEGNGPDRQRDADRIRDCWKKLQKFLAVCGGDHEAWRSTLLAIISGIEEKTGVVYEFNFVDAAKKVKVIKEVGFGLAWALNADDRVELTTTMLSLDEDGGTWFGLAQVVEANHHAFLEKNRQREEARQRRAAKEAAEESRIEELAELGDLLSVAKDVGVELSSVVSQEAITVSQTRLPEVGEVLEMKLDQLMVGQNDEGGTFVSGIRFERIAGRKEKPFLPAGCIPDRWRRLPDETVEDYEARLKASMASGALLRVEKVEKDDRGYYRVLVQIRTPEELAALRGRHIPFARPPRKLEEGESVTGRVVGTSQYGARVVFRGGVQLFAHVSNIADGLSIAVDDKVYGVVIPGHDGREFDLAIRERIVEEDKSEETPEYILHPGRIETIREFVVNRGIDLAEELQEFLRSCDERARGLVILTSEEVEKIHAFFEAILDGADRRFESVVVTLREYRREQEEAAEESQGEADIRPFCVNHEAENGEQCNRHVAEAGKQCLRCEKHGVPRKPVAGAKKRGLKGRKPKH